MFVSLYTFIKNLFTPEAPQTSVSPERRECLAKIEMYSTPICPYCMRAKSLLARKGVSFTDINIMTNPSKRTEMMQRSGGAHTVPQIFIDGKAIGGCDEMFDLEADGELDVLLGFI